MAWLQGNGPERGARVLPGSPTWILPALKRVLGLAAGAGPGRASLLGSAAYHCPGHSHQMGELGLHVGWGGSGLPMARGSWAPGRAQMDKEGPAEPWAVGEKGATTPGGRPCGSILCWHRPQGTSLPPLGTKS